MSPNEAGLASSRSCHLRWLTHFLTSAFNALTFVRSSSGSSIGVSAMKAACARRGSFNNQRNGSRPIDSLADVLMAVEL